MFHWKEWYKSVLHVPSIETIYNNYLFIPLAYSTYSTVAFCIRHTIHFQQAPYILRNNPLFQTWCNTFLIFYFWLSI